MKTWKTLLILFTLLPLNVIASDAGDENVLTRENLMEKLRGHAGLVQTPALDQFLKALAPQASGMMGIEGKILSANGWRSFRAFAAKPMIKLDDKKLQIDFMLSQTHIKHSNNTLDIHRVTDILRAEFIRKTNILGLPAISLCESEQGSSGGMQISRAMTTAQFKKVMPNPLTALARALGMGLRKISQDPFLYIGDLLGLLNKVPGVNMAPTPEEQTQIKGYATWYKPFSSAFIYNESAYVNPCDQGQGVSKPVTLAEISIF